ncbi:MAG: ribosome biogenesis GTPase Der [Bacteroidetes bacterium]|jgi:GTP-binding protein|nr:ribosome biogenesis GTPase Der [Bacteroidota bacterium]
MDNIVAIVGRPNVGKSTLFNRMIGQRKAIVDDESGVTRDRQYGECEWNGQVFTVVDTGGLVKNSDDKFEREIERQVHIAIEESKVILFMVDVTTGITDLDDRVAHILRRADRPIILLVNKVDNPQRQLLANEFYGLGFERTFFLSSTSGSGTGDFLDEVVELLPKQEEIQDLDIPKIAILGQPNVGKSSLTNALLGEERNIVTDEAGTTRDSIHSHYNKYGREFMLIDTAGIRKKSKVHEDIEFYSVLRAIKAMEEADVCIVMLDATLGLESQDLKLIGMAAQRNKGIVVVVNKWDLVEKDTDTARDFTELVRYRLAPFNDIPVIFISVIEKQRIMKVIDETLAVAEKRKKRISTSVLNDKMGKSIEKYPPPSVQGVFIKIKYCTQLPTYYPAFAFFANHPHLIKKPYRNYIENQLRMHFDFTGVPIQVYFREK